jgi:N4-gp56 family major capsid protein
MAAISLGSLTDLEKVSYVREGLPVAKPKLIYSQYAVKDRVAKREGKTRQWFRMTKPSLNSRTGDFSGTTYQYVKNTTGASPTWTPATPADTTVSAQVDFLFGQGHEWNEGVAYTSFADIPAELRKLNTMHAAEAIDTEVRDVVVAGTNVTYANQRATRPNLQATDYVDMTDIFYSVTTLRNQDAPEISGMYSALCSANVIEELMRDTAFQSAIQMQKPYIFTGTIAELYGVRFDFTSRAATTANGGSASQIATIDQTIITGDNAYGKTAWMLDDYDIVYTGPGGWGDEWANRHALTWKFAFKSVILNQNWLLRLESARR